MRKGIPHLPQTGEPELKVRVQWRSLAVAEGIDQICLLYTSDAADDSTEV